MEVACYCYSVLSEVVTRVFHLVRQTLCFLKSPAVCGCAGWLLESVGFSGCFPAVVWVFLLSLTPPVEAPADSAHPTCPPLHHTTGAADVSNNTLDTPMVCRDALWPLLDDVFCMTSSVSAFPSFQVFVLYSQKHLQSPAPPSLDPSDVVNHRTRSQEPQLSPSKWCFSAAFKDLV